MHHLLPNSTPLPSGDGNTIRPSRRILLHRNRYGMPGSITLSRMSCKRIGILLCRVMGGGGRRFGQSRRSRAWRDGRGFRQSESGGERKSGCSRDRRGLAGSRTAKWVRYQLYSVKCDGSRVRFAQRQELQVSHTPLRGKKSRF